MPLLWELFGLRSWHDHDLGALDVGTYDFMLDVAAKVKKGRAKRG